MNIPALGPLAPDPTIPEWLVSEPISIPFLSDQKLSFTLDGLEAADEADVKNAINAFLALTQDARNAAAPFVFANYRRMAGLVGEEDLGCRIASERDVWPHVQFSEVFVSQQHHGDKAIYVQIMAECDWEPEHGLQLVYRGGKELTRVSEQDGHLTNTDACDLPDTEDQVVEEPKSTADPRAAGQPTRPWWKLW